MENIFANGTTNLSSIDVTISCFQGIRPSFPLPTNLLLHTSYDPPCSFPVAGLSYLWPNVFPQNSTLGEIFGDLSTVIMTINSESKKRLIWQDAQFARIWVEPLVYRLLDCKREIPSRDITSSTDELNWIVVEQGCIIGALLLLSQVRRQFNKFATTSRPVKLFFTGHLTDELSAMLEDHAALWISLKTLLIWTCMLAAMEVGSEHDSTFSRIILHTAYDLGLSEWNEIVVMSSNLLWVGEVQDEKCNLLGQRMNMIRLAVDNMDNRSSSNLLAALSP
jgi:hypothetical protein